MIENDQGEYESVMAWSNKGPIKYADRRCAWAPKWWRNWRYRQGLRVFKLGRFRLDVFLGDWMQPYVRLQGKRRVIFCWRGEAGKVEKPPSDEITLTVRMRKKL